MSRCLFPGLRLCLFSGFRAVCGQEKTCAARVAGCLRHECWQCGSFPRVKHVKVHTSGFVLRSAGLITLVLSSVAFLHYAGPLTRSNHRSGLAAQRGITDLNDPKQLLAEADRLAWMFNSQAAAPLYARAEKLFATNTPFPAKRTSASPARSYTQ